MDKKTREIQSIPSKNRELLKKVIWVGGILWLIDMLAFGGYFIAPLSFVVLVFVGFIMIKRYQSKNKPLPSVLEFLYSQVVECHSPEVEKKKDDNGN